MAGGGHFAFVLALPLRQRKSAVVPGDKPFPRPPAGPQGRAVSAMPVPVLSSSLRFGSVSDQRENVAGNHFPA